MLDSENFMCCKNLSFSDGFFLFFLFFCASSTLASALHSFLMREGSAETRDCICLGDHRLQLGLVVLFLLSNALLILAPLLNLVVVGCGRLVNRRGFQLGQIYRRRGWLYRVGSVVAHFVFLPANLSVLPLVLPVFFVGLAETVLVV